MNKQLEETAVAAGRSRKFIGIRTFIIFVLLFALVPFGALFLSGLYSKYIEHTPPTIEILEAPRGLGTAPVTLHVRFRDLDSGLDEAVIRIRQRGTPREIKRISFDGKSEGELTVSFEGSKSELVEGIATIELKAFDRSFWSNAREEVLQLRVDYHKPKIEVLSTQHNARLGGSQLLFYQAYDENLAISGVRVGTQTFLGSPARGLDKDLTDPNLYAVIYAVPLDFDPARDTIRAFVEDNAGNTVTKSFYNKASGRPSRAVTARVGEDFVRDKVMPLQREYREEIARFDGGGIHADSGVEDRPERQGQEQSAELPLIFDQVNRVLRARDEAKIVRLLSAAPGREALWQGLFIRPPMTVQSSFADRLQYLYVGADQQLGEQHQFGIELLPSRNQTDVLAANNGLVIFVESFPVYGRTVAIDHGFNIATVYSQLGNVVVAKGESVQKGQTIASGGGSGLTRNGAIRVELRIQGLAVDPQEWFDGSWFFSHIIGKTNDLRRSLGLQAFLPLNDSTF